jgi:hypothetical protein
MEPSTDASVAALMSALSHGARFESHGASLEDAKKHPGKENRNLSLGLYLLQGTRHGERIFDVCVADGNVYSTLLARTRSTSDNRDLQFAIRAPVGHDVLHLLLTLQAESVSLNVFGPVGASVAPVSMPTKAQFFHLRRKTSRRLTNERSRRRDFCGPSIRFRSVTLSQRT